MSFLGSDERVYHGVGVSKMTEDVGQDWWNKHLTNFANSTRMNTLNTGGMLVTQINKYINSRIAERFGLTFKGEINRSYADEKKMGDAITDPLFDGVIDYAVGNSPAIQAVRYIQGEYGQPRYDKCPSERPMYLIDGEWKAIVNTVLGYTGGYPKFKKSSIGIGLGSCTGEAERYISIPYQEEPMVIITYKLKTPIEYPNYLYEGENLLVDGNGVGLADGVREQKTRFWFVDRKDVIIEKYVTAPFFVLDYKRNGGISLNKFIFVMNNRLGVGNDGDPCTGGGGPFGGATSIRDILVPDSGLGLGIDGRVFTGRYDWTTTMYGREPEGVFSIKPQRTYTSVSCADKNKNQRKEVESDNPLGVPSGSSLRDILVGNYNSDPSTINGLLDTESNKTVLLSFMSRYTNDKEHNQHKYKEILDEMLDVDGKYNIGFIPASAAGKGARGNFRGKGLGGYSVRVHDVTISYVDYFVVVQDNTDYGSLDKVLGWIGQDEKVADQCETRDENTGYSLVIDEFPLRLYDNNDSGGCGVRNDNFVQYLIPIDWLETRTMPEKYRDYKELLGMMIQSTEVKKLKWYERSLFKLVMVIVSIVASVYTFGAAWGLSLSAVGFIVSALEISPYLKLAINLIIGGFVNPAGFASYLTTGSILNIAQQLATIYVQEYMMDAAKAARLRAKEAETEAKAAEKALAEAQLEGMYNPLETIDESYDAPYELLYNMYDKSTSVEEMLQIKRGVPR